VLSAAEAQKISQDRREMPSAIMLERFIGFQISDLRFSDFTNRALIRRNLKSAIGNLQWLPPVAIRRSHLTQKVEFIEAFARSFRHGLSGSSATWTANRSPRSKVCQPAQQRAATRSTTRGPPDPRTIRRTTLERDAHRIDYRRDRFEQRFAHFLRRDHERLGQSRDEVAAFTSTLVSFSLG